MKKMIAAYKNHTSAVKAVNLLRTHFFALKKVSIQKYTESTETNIQFVINRRKEYVLFGVIVFACALFGLLSGLRVFKIPGFSILNDSGGAIGLFAGIVGGVVIGGGISILLTVIKKRGDSMVNFDSNLTNLKYELIIDGSAKDIARAEKILRNNRFGLT